MKGNSTNYIDTKRNVLISPLNEKNDNYKGNENLILHDDVCLKIEFGNSTNFNDDTFNSKHS